MGIKTAEILNSGALDDSTDPKDHYGWLVWCPACEAPHNFDTRWSFVNNDHERPTFTASMLVYERPGKARCHSFLTDGVWHYCSDSGHEHAGKSLPAPDWADTPFGRMRKDGVVPSP